MSEAAKWLVGLGAVAVPVVLAVGSWRSGTSLRGCCSVADPRRDLRMRAAFDDGPDTRDPARP